MRQLDLRVIETPTTLVGKPPDGECVGFIVPPNSRFFTTQPYGDTRAKYYYLSPQDAGVSVSSRDHHPAVLLHLRPAPPPGTSKNTRQRDPVAQRERQLRRTHANKERKNEKKAMLQREKAGAPGAAERVAAGAATIAALEAAGRAAAPSSAAAAASPAEAAGGAAASSSAAAAGSPTFAAAALGAAASASASDMEAERSSDDDDVEILSVTLPEASASTAAAAPSLAASGAAASASARPAASASSAAAAPRSAASGAAASASARPNAVASSAAAAPRSAASGAAASARASAATGKWRRTKVYNVFIGPDGTVFDLRDPQDLSRTPELLANYQRMLRIHSRSLDKNAPELRGWRRKSHSYWREKAPAPPRPPELDPRPYSPRDSERDWLDPYPPDPPDGLLTFWWPPTPELANWQWGVRARHMGQGERWAHWYERDWSLTSGHWPWWSRHPNRGRGKGRGGRAGGKGRPSTVRLRPRSDSR